MLKAPEAIFFDWDGTLVDTMGLLQEANNKVRAHFSLKPLSLEEVYRNTRYSARELFPKLYGERSDEAQKILYDFIDQHHLSFLKPMEHSVAILDVVSQKNLPSGVVSNKRHTVICKEIEHLQWNTYFRSVIGAGEALRDKPSPEPLLLALERASVSPQEHNIWYVGDGESDLICARDAGCVQVFVTHGSDKSDLIYQYQPALVVETLKDLEKILKYNHVGADEKKAC